MVRGQLHDVPEVATKVVKITHHPQGHRQSLSSEVLTDNGKQFAGRFTRPYPAEVLFERICRENGISQRLTKRRSPTTAGKIERFHKTLREELLDDVEAFESLDAAQDAISEWVHEYNHSRPHESLDVATLASLFRPNKPKTLTVPSDGAGACRRRRRFRLRCRWGVGPGPAGHRGACGGGSRVPSAAKWFISLSPAARKFGSARSTRVGPS